MCGPADFTALGESLARLGALTLAGGGLLTASRIAYLLKELRSAKKPGEEEEGQDISPARE